MKVIVGMMDNRLKAFIKRYHFSSKIIVINKMCNVKTIKGEVDVIVPFGKVNDKGLVNNTMVHFEELLMSLNVLTIKYGNLTAKPYYEEVAKKYGIACEYIDLNDHTSNIIL